VNGSAIASMGLDLLIVMDMVVCMCLVSENVRESKIEFSFGGLICLVCEKVRESKRFFFFFFLGGLYMLVL
jgi:hypothetical protein